MARSLVLVANSEALEAWPEEYRTALLEAAAVSFEDALEATRTEDRLPDDHRAEVCGAGLEMVELTEDELAAVRAAVEPAYEALRAVAGAAAYLDEIEALKAELAHRPTSSPATDGQSR
ncbi:hypothetical protein [Ornithinimicrobium humiphilum]|uniref:hypothetical protein n=1 Tax=Ornithinimicrobium humiphilum TaxID=125288 RepID=UPI001152F57B|nr:hypothetical protein [Ornithinimicrobium humiphilum]